MGQSVTKPEHGCVYSLDGPNQPEERFTSEVNDWTYTIQGSEEREQASKQNEYTTTGKSSRRHADYRQQLGKPLTGTAHSDQDYTKQVERGNKEKYGASHQPDQWQPGSESPAYQRQGGSQQVEDQDHSLDTQDKRIERPDYEEDGAV